MMDKGFTTNSDINLEAIEKDSDAEVAKVIKPARPRRFNRRSGDKQQYKSNTWLISFTDVMALMLTFFVLLFSMSDPDPAQWDKIKDELQETLNPQKVESENMAQGQPLNRGAQDNINIDKVNFSKALSLPYLEKLFAKQIEKQPSLSNVLMMEIDGGLMISLPQQLLFEVGQASIKETGVEALYDLAGILNRIKNRVEIVGHTDPRSVSGDQFQSNWELSLARAANVAGVLENVGYTNDLTIRGHASARFNDLDVDMPIRARRDLSRRVDIVIMEDDGKALRLFNISLP